ncbi:MAG: uL15 family ribosomal protein [Clostridia bacterium]|nr:uL15 family ribosomal protein [Clostridia bacterium]
MSKKFFRSISRTLVLLTIAALILMSGAVIISATDSDTLLIGSTDELYALAAQVNGGDNLEGVTVSLTADITLNAGTFDQNGNWSEAGSPAEWTPIGNTFFPFSGTFNGNGHTVSGLYCNAENGFQGLFGHIVDGNIENVNLKNSYVGGGYYVGGIVGYANAVSKDCYIKNCNVSVYTDCKNQYEGAIAGCVVGNFAIEGYTSVSNDSAFGTLGDDVQLNTSGSTENITPNEQNALPFDMLWLCIALAVLILIILIIVIVITVRRKKKANDEQDETPPEQPAEPVVLETTPESELESEPEPEPEPTSPVAPIIIAAAEKDPNLGYYYIKKTANGGYMFNLKAANHEIITTSETYNSLSSCKKGIQSMARNAADANIDDLTKESEQKVRAPKFELYTDKAGKFRFRLKAGNYEIIASSQAYASKSGCKNGIESVIKNSQTTKIVIEDAETGERIQKLRAVVAEHEGVSADEVKNMLEDEIAEALVVEEVTEEAWVKQSCEIINIDTISDNFQNGDTVDVAALVERGLLPKSTKHVKVLARGMLDKALTVKANQFSADAVKMIVLMGGSAIHTNK